MLYFRISGHYFTKSSNILMKALFPFISSGTTKMYGPEPDNSLNPSFTTSSGILQERNTHYPSSPARSWLDHISESSRRRHEVFLLKQRKEKLRRRRMVRRREYQRLRNMVPSIAKKPAVSKVSDNIKLTLQRARLRQFYRTPVYLYIDITRRRN